MLGDDGSNRSPFTARCGGHHRPSDYSSHHLFLDGRDLEKLQKADPPCSHLPASVMTDAGVVCPMFPLKHVWPVGL